MEARAAGELSRRLRVLTHPALLVVDEIGYLLAAYQCIREAPLTDLERSALAELPPADTLSWLAQADGAEGLRGAA